MSEETDLSASQKDADALQSLPALLERNATRFASKPAYREKEFGIWQSWTWAETAREIGRAHV